MKTVIEKEAKQMLCELNSRKNAVESMKRKIACGEGGLEARLRRIKTDVEITETAFAQLNYRERDILTAFYVDRERDAAVRLGDKYGCSKSTVYRMKRAAMREFTVRVFGDA